MDKKIIGFSDMLDYFGDLAILMKELPVRAFYCDSRDYNPPILVVSPVKEDGNCLLMPAMSDVIRMKFVEDFADNFNRNAKSRLGIVALKEGYEDSVSWRFVLQRL